MFFSTFDTALDAKGRVSVPSTFRSALGGGNRIFIWPAVDGSGALEGGGEELVQALTETLKRMPPSRREAYMHAYFTCASEVKMDDTGRITLPANQLAKAGITKELVFAGMFDRFRIWEPARFEAYSERMSKAAAENTDLLDESFEVEKTERHIALGAGGKG